LCDQTIKRYYEETL
jgi:hypothetical protein